MTPEEIKEEKDKQREERSKLREESNAIKKETRDKVMKLIEQAKAVKRKP